MPPAIKVENLGKSYLVGHNNAQAERYTALRDVLTRNARNLARKTRDMLTGRQIVQGDEVEEFWALKDINFEIQPGDRVGIIGRNGAGKSTLLKILSRITEPTTGRVTINGRVASLLEVGTGFHPELTGRENIFLNGAILGMGRKEIQRKFDEIVDFAEVEKFLDTPVKRYSSGMYVRLAFAVAAHLEPEILVVDEVLAVGDAQFQKKCLGKMEDMGRGGRTILFVSHNMGMISNICDKGVFLENGKITMIGNIDRCIDRYGESSSSGYKEVQVIRTPNPNQKILVKSVSLRNADKIINNKNDLFVDIIFQILRPGQSYSIGVEVESLSRGIAFSSGTLDDRPVIDRGLFDKIGNYTASVKLPVSWFLEGSYSIRVAASIPSVEVLDVFPQEVVFNVYDSSSPVAVLGEGRRGVLAPRLEWLITAES